jgi:hypothetical protein
MRCRQKEFLMKTDEGILTEDKFEEKPLLYKQNSIDGRKLIEEPTNEIIPNTLFIVTPCMGTLMLSYVKSILELQSLCHAKKIIAKFHMVQSSMVTQGRNLCVQAFLQSNYSHMLFLDSDIEFDSGSIFFMIKADKDIVLTPYPMKVFDWNKARRLSQKTGRPIEECPHFYCLEFPDDKNIVSKNGLCEIVKGPAGCMLIKREVFDKMIKSYPKMKIKQKQLVNGLMSTSENVWNFFDTDFNSETGKFTGEDYAFCDRWIAIGGKIYANVEAYITHWGYHGFHGRFIDEGKKVK